MILLLSSRRLRENPSRFRDFTNVQSPSNTLEEGTLLRRAVMYSTGEFLFRSRPIVVFTNSRLFLLLRKRVPVYIFARYSVVNTRVEIRSISIRYYYLNRLDMLKQSRY